MENINSVCLSENNLYSVDDDDKKICSVPITLGENTFEIFLTYDEIDLFSNKMNSFSDCDFPTTVGILALEKLAEYLKLSTKIYFNKDISIV